jgi:uncharacterized protein (UPF0332 family)
MNERDFLAVAKLLAGESTEAAWRSAVSRAYYAAFHVARSLLEELGFTVPRADKAHDFLYVRLNNCGDPQVGPAGRQLKQLRDDRNQCDYNLRRLIPQHFASSQIRVAELIIQTLDAARLEPTRTQITDAMKIYERDVLHNVTWHP